MPFRPGPGSISKSSRICDWPWELCLLTLQGSDAQHGNLCLELAVRGDAIEVTSTHEGAAAGESSDPEADESARLSEQILDVLVDEHGREIHDGSGAGMAPQATDGTWGARVGPEHDPGPDLHARVSVQPVTRSDRT